jgi:hypothetical protein
VQVFSENFGFPCQSTFHLLLQNHLHYHPRLAQQARSGRCANSLTNQNKKTGREGPYGCETSRLPYFLLNRLTEGSKVVSLTLRKAKNSTNKLRISRTIWAKLRFVQRGGGGGRIMFTWRRHTQQTRQGILEATNHSAAIIALYHCTCITLRVLCCLEATDPAVLL